VASVAYAYALYRLNSGVLSYSIYTVECGSILLRYSEIEGGEVMSNELGICAKCETGEYLTLSITIGDIICQGCGEWQEAILNDVYARVDL